MKIKASWYHGKKKQSDIIFQKGCFVAVALGVLLLSASDDVTSRVTLLTTMRPFLNKPTTYFMTLTGL